MCRLASVKKLIIVQDVINLQTDKVKKIQVLNKGLSYRIVAMFIIYLHPSIHFNVSRRS